MVDEARLTADSVRNSSVAGDVKGDDRAEPLEHPFRGCMGRMSLQTWISNAADAGMG